MAHATAADGTRLSYETAGEGPAVILLHGGGQSRQVWTEPGYVARLAAGRRVIAMDLRGHGDSDKPVRRSDYAIETVVGDVLAVADACGADRFDLVGYSYGGNIGRYVAARSGRVGRFVLIGIGFGRGAEGGFRDRIAGVLAPWAPALERGDVDALEPAQQAMWRSGAIQPLLAWFGALLDWPAVTPTDLAGPTLWLVGGDNEVGALDSLAQHRPGLPPTFTVEIVPGLNHAQEISEIDRVLPPIEAFLAL